MKILLFGKNGQVGWELQRSLSVLGEVVALDFDSTDFCGDFTNVQGLVDTVRLVRPNIIVNAAAYTAVDKAESEPNLAHTINALAPGALAQEATLSNAWLVHYSTDYVFDGRGNNPWRETDVPIPLNVYGKTKLEGERLIAKSGCLHLILRTSWVYAARGNNFVKTMLRLAQERNSLNVIDDQIGAPTGADLLADATAHAIRHVVRESTPSGVYHLTASGETSWYGYAKLVLENAKKAGISLQVKPDSINPVPSANFPTPAARPQNSCLDTNLFQSIFGLYLPPWEQGVTRMLAETFQEQLS